MKIIGLTGGIGSGKSTVSSYFKELGIPVFDADAVSRAAVRKGSDCLADIVAFFGPDCLLENGELNRPWVAQRVFGDPKLLQPCRSSGPCGGTVRKKRRWKHASKRRCR